MRPLQEIGRDQAGEPATNYRYTRLQGKGVLRPKVKACDLYLRAAVEGLVAVLAGRLGRDGRAEGFRHQGVDAKAGMLEPTRSRTLE